MLSYLWQLPTSYYRTSGKLQVYNTMLSHLWQLPAPLSALERIKARLRPRLLLPYLWQITTSYYRYSDNFQSIIIVPLTTLNFLLSYIWQLPTPLSNCYRTSGNFQRHSAGWKVLRDGSAPGSLRTNRMRRQCLTNSAT